MTTISDNNSLLEQKDNSLWEAAKAKQSQPKATKDPLRALKAGVWIYFFFLIFEGALRKWFLQGLSAPLLIVRDPIGIILILMAMHKRIFDVNKYVIAMVVVAVLSICATMILGHKNYIVALYGARLYIINFPLMYVFGNVFTRNDVIKMGKLTLLICIPMTVLVGMQFYSPQTAWVNQGVGGDEGGAGFSGALSYFRPPGTFSFTNGNTLFYGFAAAFVMFFWISEKLINKYLLFLATTAVLFALPLSISRALFGAILISTGFAFLAVIRKPKLARRIFVAFVGISLAFIIISQLGIFQKATEALITRFDNAQAGEGMSLLQAFFERFTYSIAIVVEYSGGLPFFGLGLGMGTNVGALLLSGQVTFLISEEEWGRVIGESGFLLGGIILLIRVIFVANLSLASYQKVGAEGSVLPWMLMSFGALNLLNGQWGQPTSLGFSTLIGGLIIAALKDREDWNVGLPNNLSQNTIEVKQTPQNSTKLERN